MDTRPVGQKELPESELPHDDDPPLSLEHDDPESLLLELPLSLAEEDDDPESHEALAPPPPNEPPPGVNDGTASPGTLEAAPEYGIIQNGIVDGVSATTGEAATTRALRALETYSSQHSGWNVSIPRPLTNSSTVKPQIRRLHSQQSTRLNSGMVASCLGVSRPWVYSSLTGFVTHGDGICQHRQFSSPASHARSAPPLPDCALRSRRSPACGGGVRTSVAGISRAWLSAGR